MQKLKALVRARALDSDLDSELASHIDLAVDELVEAGLTPEEARRQAILRLGGIQQARETQREARGLP